MHKFGLFSQTNRKKEVVILQITATEYKKMTTVIAPRSKVFQNCRNAFLVGGGICALGQIIAELATAAGLDDKTAALCGSLFLIFLAVLLTGLNVFDKIAKHAGAGTIVPITGFANAIASPAVEFKSEGYVTGMGVKMFSVAGPVLVFGISASVVYGLILWLVSLF